MANIIIYKGYKMTDSATGQSGIALNENFTKVADDVEALQAAPPAHTHTASDVTDFDASVTTSTHAGRTDNPHSVTAAQVGIVNNLELNGFRQKIGTPSSSLGALTLDMDGINDFDVTLTESVTSLTISNQAPATWRTILTLVVRQDATGGWTITWPASFRWHGGTAPTQTTDPNAIDIFQIESWDNGTTWFAFSAGLGMAAP